MSKAKKLTIAVRGTAITILSQRDEDYISLTDIAKHKCQGSDQNQPVWVTSKPAS